MNVEQLADKLRQMRAAGAGRDKDVMTRLFGVIFYKEIGNNAKAIVDAYERRKSAEGKVKWPGKPNADVIQDGRKLAEHVDPRDDEKWKRLG